MFGDNGKMLLNTEDRRTSPFQGGSRGISGLADGLFTSPCPPSKGGLLCLRAVSIAALLLAALLAPGCRQKMADQPRYEPYDLSTFYEDSLAMRPLEPGVVPRTVEGADPAYYAAADPFAEEGFVEGEAGYETRLTDEMPFPATLEVLERGQQQFNVFCSPCHGRVGNGQGMIVMRGLRMPNSFHTERLRAAPLGHFYHVITHGYGAMYSYAARVEPADRWAIAAYIRALQLSQHAALEDVPADRREEMGVLQP